MNTKVLQVTATVLVLFMLALAAFSAASVMRADSIAGGGIVPQPGPWAFYEGGAQAAPQRIAGPWGHDGPQAAPQMIAGGGIIPNP